MRKPVISVCVTTYNQRDYIDLCLRSILDQQVDAEMQLLVGDDASTDGTSEVIAALVQEYGSRVQHLVRSPNLGAFENMCDLIGRAEGDFIARVDGDDYWLPGKLARQLAYLKCHAGCVAVFTNAVTVDEAGKILGHFNDLGDVQLDLAALVRRGNVLNNSSVLFRNGNQYAWLERSEQIDYQLHLELVRNGQLGHIAEPLAVYRVATRGSMVAASNARVRELYWQAIQSVPRDLVNDADYAHGLADFLRRVLFRSIATRSLALLRTWVARVYAVSPYGRVRMTTLVAANTLRMAGKMLVAYISFSGYEKNVLYRH
ncbi:glycosyltransferase [Luteimonas sp. SMYT11W]|uniref:Glycosyltransferase n=1 Tax=Luteimonas flava TaxID=3115822 RepID=A0ABU7WJC2_9GAMM